MRKEGRIPWLTGFAGKADSRHVACLRLALMVGLLHLLAPHAPAAAPPIGPTQTVEATSLRGKVMCGYLRLAGEGARMLRQRLPIPVQIRLTR